MHMQVFYDCSGDKLSNGVCVQFLLDEKEGVATNITTIPEVVIVTASIHGSVLL